VYPGCPRPSPWLAGEIAIEPTSSRLDDLFRELANYAVDFCDVRGQEMAKRAIIVAAAGGHNLLKLEPITSISLSCYVANTCAL
jgi:predicted ATPase with chaperone activity